MFEGYTQPDIIGGYVIAYLTLATAQSVAVLTEFNLLFHLEYSAWALFADI